MFSFCVFFTDTATTEIYTLSLHDALPICDRGLSADDADQRFLAMPRFESYDEISCVRPVLGLPVRESLTAGGMQADRKSTRLNSSHSQISYAVFCLKKKNKHNKDDEEQSC